MTDNKSLVKAYGVIPIFKNEDSSKDYLIVQNHDGYWGFPKGGANANEAPKEAALRELLEETGIVVTPEDLGESISYEYSMPTSEGIKDKIVYLFPANVSSKDVTIQNVELKQYKWAKIDEVLKLIELDSLTRKLEAIDGNQ